MIVDSIPLGVFSVGDLCGQDGTCISSVPNTIEPRGKHTESRITCENGATLVILQRGCGEGGRAGKVYEGTYVLQEDLKNTAGLFVDETRDTLHTAATSETTDSLWLER